MKLLGIGLGTFIILALLWATLWFWGRGQSYQAYNHPLLKQKTPIEALEAESLLSASEFVGAQPQRALVLKLHMSQDGRFFTAPPQAFDFLKDLSRLGSENFRGQKHYFYTYDFLKSNVDTLIPLEAWMSLNPSFWIFDLQDNAFDLDRHLTEWIEKYKMQDRVIIKSEIDLIVSSVKEKNPGWIFGSTRSDLTKLLTLASIGLEGLANFQRDVFFTPLSINGRDVLKSDVVEEIRKRMKWVAIGPLHTKEDRDVATKFNPDIFILAHLLDEKKVD